MTTVLFSITFVQAIQAGNTLILGYPKEITLISSFLKGWNFPVFFVYVTFSPSRSVRCETKEPPAMRVRIEGYTKKTPNAIQ